jgi:ubiquinone/menaquinone biosynthesis C-methylase UbiE
MARNLMSETANLYEDGNAYERMMGRWSGIAGEKFVDWFDLPKGLRWVDVGCGNGAFTEVLIARCAPAATMAVDPSEAQLAFARARPDTSSAEFRVGSAETLPLLDGSFDVAVMALVLSLLPDAVKAAAEMARVVRTGGIVATYMWDVPGGGLPTEPIYRVMRSLGLDPILGPGAANSAADKMYAAWEQAELEAVETCTIRVPIVYSSFDDFWESNDVPVGPSGNALRAMRPDLKEKLKQGLHQYLLHDHPDGRVSYEAFANAVKGKVPD